jgi:peptide/nickel transport system permease protein
MLGNADTYISNGQWWLVYPVGFCLVAVVMACNLVGDALRDAFDVRLRRR